MVDQDLIGCDSCIGSFSGGGWERDERKKEATEAENTCQMQSTKLDGSDTDVTEPKDGMHSPVRANERRSRSGSHNKWGTRRTRSLPATLTSQRSNTMRR